MSGEAGGAAAAGGIAYQARVAAWAAARILAEEWASGFWGFSSISLVALYCETGSGVDDLLLVTSDAGELFIQAKRRIDLGQGAGSELASYVAQCVIYEGCAIVKAWSAPGSWQALVAAGQGWSRGPVIYSGGVAHGVVRPGRLNQAGGRCTARP